MRQTAKIVLVLLFAGGLGCLLGGSLVLSHGIVGLREAGRLTGWVAKPGKVVSAERRDGDGKAYADIRYQYRIGGMIFQGSNVAADRLGAVESLAPAYLKKYPQGQSVTVYVDPQDPRRAVLERPDPQRAYVAIAVGGAMLLVGLTALQVWRRRLRRG